ncbi:hypothetical protein [Plantactinospora sp. WMMB782]|uniref:hypothetical protein n=1 Tax=Plantactinospora sp. WMMB782 TaxID=3404121 RepID=UPI003B9452F1
MPDGRGLWQLVDFEARFDAWADRDNPSTELRIVVAEWILTRMEDPYEGARREPGFPDLWSVRIRGTAVGRPGAFTMVLCSFWIKETEHGVVCDNFATLGYPV